MWVDEENGADFKMSFPIIDITDFIGNLVLMYEEYVKNKTESLCEQLILCIYRKSQSSNFPVIFLGLLSENGLCI